MRPYLLPLLVSFYLNAAMAQDANEPNNSFSDATTVQLVDLKAEIQGSIHVAGDVDYYTVEVPRAEVLELDVSDVAENIQIEIQIYDARQDPLTQTRSAGAGQPGNLLYLVCAPGTYFISLNARFNQQASAALYTLGVNFDTTDVYECNNNFVTATPIEIGDTIRATVRAASDMDFYAVEVPRAGVFVIDVSDVAQNIQMEVQLYDERQAPLTQTRSDGGGRPANLTYLACSAGTYYISLNARFNQQASAELYTFSVDFDTTDVYECNNNFVTATPVSTGDTVRAAIRASNDMDYYAVEVPRAGVFVLDVSDVAQNIQMEVQLYDERQAPLIQTRSDGAGQPASLVYLVCDPGTYFVSLNARFNQQASAELYSFSVGFDTTDVYECNNNFMTATPVSIGDTINAAIRAAADIDYYTVEVPRAGIFVLDVSDVAQNIQMETQLYDERQAPLSQTRSDGGGQPSSLLYQVCTPGVYYISFNARFNQQTSAELYTFRVGFDTTDIYECNSTFQTAAPINFCEDVRGAFFPSADVDVYSFQADQGDSITVDLRNVATGIVPVLAIYDEAQADVTYLQSEPSAPATFTAAVTGTYYVALTPNRNSQFSSELYNLTISDSTSCGTTPVNVILTEGSIAVAPNPTTDRLVVSYRGKLAPAHTQLVIYGTTGQQLASYSELRSGATLDISALPTGLLFLQFRLRNEVSTLRVMKQ